MEYRVQYPQCLTILYVGWVIKFQNKLQVSPSLRRLLTWLVKDYHSTLPCIFQMTTIKRSIVWNAEFYLFVRNENILKNLST